MNGGKNLLYECKVHGKECRFWLDVTGPWAAVGAKLANEWMLQCAFYSEPDSARAVAHHLVSARRVQARCLAAKDELSDGVGLV